MSHLDRAKRETNEAYALDSDVEQAENAKDWRRVGRLQARQRMHMKRAEVAAIMAVAQGLERIGLSQ